MTAVMPLGTDFEGPEPDPVGSMATVQLLRNPGLMKPTLTSRTTELDRHKDLVAIVTALVDVYDNRGAVIWLQIGQFGQGHHDTAMDLIRWGRAAEVIARIEHLQSGPTA